MKWIFYFLLLANAGYFLWQVKYREPPPAPVATLEMHLPGNVNRLLLLGEYDASRLRERSSVAQAPPSSVAQADQTAAAGGASPLEEQVPVEDEAQADVCFSVGPLRGGGDETRVGVWLRSHGGQSTLREGERREVALFWVYFPPFQTREAAVKRVLDMRAQGIADIYVIPRGDMANAISLGLYSHRVSLERRIEALRAQGYDPSVVPRYKTTKAAWLDVRFPAGRPFPRERFGELFPDTEAVRAKCT